MKNKQLKKLVIGNWKLNPLSLAEAERLASRIDPTPVHETVICPPTLFIASVNYPVLGAQDCFWENKGVHTGETSPLALKKLGVKYCLVGHSERRNNGETELEIRKKIEALLSVKIVPVLCVGFGTTVEEDDLEVTDVLKGQLTSALKGLATSPVVVAYEPVWAISSGNSYGHKVATPDHAEKIAMFIETKFSVKKVLYGGSVNSTNAKGFMEQPHIAGLLVGGASLLPGDFNKIINIEVSK